MARDDVTISVGLDTDDIKKDIRLITNSVKVLGAAFAAAFAGDKIIRGIREITQAASVQEDAINALNTSLKLAGEFSEDASQDFQDFASALQSVTTTGDETTLQLAALARNFTTSNEQAKELTEAALNLSAATGISLDGAVRNLGKSLGGLAGELGESVKGIRELSPEALKSGAAIELVAKRFDGAAASLRNTFSGAVQAAQNSFGDFLEELGFAITQNPAVISALNELSDAFSDIGTFVKSNREEISLFISEGIIALVKALKVLADAFADNFNEIVNTFRVFSVASSVAFDGFEASAKTVQKVLVEIARSFTAWRVVVNQALGDEEGIQVAQENLEALRQVSADLTRDIAKDGEEIQETFKEFTKALETPETSQNNKLLKLLKDISDELDEITDKAKDIQVGGDVNVTQAGVGGSGIGGDVGTSAFGEDLNESLREFSTGVTDAANSFGESIVDAIINTGLILTNVLIGGAEAFANASAEEQKKIAEESAEVFVTEAAGGIADALLPGAGQFVSALLDLAGDPESFQAFIEAFTEALPRVIQTIVDGIPLVIQALVDNLPAIVRAFINAIPDIIDALVEAAPELIATLIELAPEIAIKLAVALVEAAPDIVLALIEGIGKGLIKVFDNLIDNIEDKFSIGTGGGGTLGQIGEALGFADGGIVPPGFPNDTFPALLTSGERVLTEDQQKDMAVPQMITVNLVMDEQILATQILEVNRDNLRTA